MRMLEHSPNTAMLLGAVLSGGDALAFADAIKETHDGSK